MDELTKPGTKKYLLEAICESLVRIDAHLERIELLTRVKMGILPSDDELENENEPDHLRLWKCDRCGNMYPEPVVFRKRNYCPSCEKLEMRALGFEVTSSDEEGSE